MQDDCTLEAGIFNQEDKTKAQAATSAQLHIHLEWTFKVTQTFKVFIRFISDNLYI